MTDILLLLVSDYGLVVIFAATLLSCFALPVPSSLMMMAGGAFSASGDLVLWQVSAVALAGAMIGDLTGYFLARRGGGENLWARLRTLPHSANLMARAEAFLHRRGGWAVFLTRWLFSPLGPYVNLIAAAFAGRDTPRRTWQAKSPGSRSMSRLALPSAARSKNCQTRSALSSAR